MWCTRSRLVLCLSLLCLGCGEEAPQQPRPASGLPAGELSAAVGAEQGIVRVVFLGDSLTAGLGLGETEAFPARVGAALQALGRDIEVVNAGVSGDTTAGGLGRLGWILRQESAVIVVGLGANDGLRGLPLAATEENLRRIVERIHAAGVEVLLLGMRIPPSYGPEYSEGFAAIYPRLAVELEVELVPFLLAGVGGQADGIHPNAAGQRQVAANVVPHLEALLVSLPDPAR